MLTIYATREAAEEIAQEGFAIDGIKRIVRFWAWANRWIVFTETVTETETQGGQTAEDACARACGL